MSFLFDLLDLGWIGLRERKGGIGAGEERKIWGGNERNGEKDAIYRRSQMNGREASKSIYAGKDKRKKIGANSHHETRKRVEKLISEMQSQSEGKKMEVRSLKNNPNRGCRWLKVRRSTSCR